MRTFSTLAVTLLGTGLALASGGTFAADPHAGMNHGSMNHEMTNHGSHKIERTPMQAELAAGMDRMHADMHAGMMLLDADAAFAAGMVPHHKGAVRMAEVELKYGKDPEMRKLAEAIIAAQGPEIEQMNAWLARNPEKTKEKGESHADMLPMHKELMTGMTDMHEGMAKSLNVTDADIAFAVGMIPHHQGAVEMAEVELKYGKDPEMRELAEAIVAAQGPEIEQMQAWLKSKNVDLATCCK